MIILFVVLDGVDEDFLGHRVRRLCDLLDEEVDALLVLFGQEAIEELGHRLGLELLKAFDQTVEAVFHFLESVHQQMHLLLLVLLQH